MGDYSIDPTGTNPPGTMPQQGAAVSKPSLWDRWIQNAYSLRPLESTLSQAGNTLGQRSINMLHGDGFRPDAQVYPPPPPPQALAARPLANPPVRGGVSALVTGQGATQASQYNIPRQPVQGQVQPPGPATVGGHQFSPQALAWMKRCEGGYSHDGNPYDHDGSAAGNCTVGYGHLLHSGPCDGRAGERHISRPEADSYFMDDARQHQDWLNQHVQVPLNQNQFDSLGSLHFNLKNFPDHDVWKHDLKDPAHAELNNVPSDIRTLGGGGKGVSFRRDGEANMWNGVYPDLSDPNVCNAGRKR
jgi:hypothetical protein